MNIKLIVALILSVFANIINAQDLGVVFKDPVAGNPAPVGNINLNINADLFVDGVQVEEVEVTKPPFWMITSPGAIRAYALSQVRRGTAYVWGETLIDKPDSKTWTDFSGDNPHEILFNLENEGGSLTFHVLDPEKDSIQRGGALTDKDGNYLFSGYEWGVKPFKSNGSWRLPRSNIKLRLESYIPIPLPEGFSGGAIYYRDDGGEFRWSDYDLWFNNGRLWFPIEYAGKKGQLVLYSKSGTIAIDLHTGREMSPSRISAGTFAELPNYFKVNDKGVAGILNFDIHAIASDKQSDAPIAWVTLFSGPRNVSFTAAITDDAGSVLELPTQAWAMNKQSGKIKSISAFQIIGANGQISNPLFQTYLDEGGDWIIWLQSDYFNQPPSPPYYGGSVGGKG